MDPIQQIRERIDIVSLISEYIPLKKLGRNFTCVCPFHNEKTPSFVVSPERQIWHCFGCAKGGDAFTFLMEYENLEFVEALRILAAKTGVEVKKLESFQGSSQKEKIYSLNNLASEYYHYILIHHKAGRKALDYLVSKRGLSKELIESFNIGFAPGGNSLTKYLIEKKKNNRGDLVEAGLASQSGPRTFDFFRNRIIFPLIDQRGNSVGFSARVIEDIADAPKYINSRETIVYHKGGMFFGLNRAWQAIKKEENAIIVEGEFDVISLFKEGIENAVAIKGTALTETQALLISRFTPKITLCLDQDEAGFGATKRSLPILEKRGLTTNVIVLTQGKDPDQAVEENPSQFKKDLKNAIGIYDFILEKLEKQHDSKTPDGKKKIAEEMLPLVSNIGNEIIKEHYLKKLSSLIDTSYESLIKQLDKTSDKETALDKKFSRKDKRERREVLEEYLLALLIQNKKSKFVSIKVSDVLKGYVFMNKSFGEIYGALIKYFNTNETLNNKEFAVGVSTGLTKTFDMLYLRPLPEFSEDDQMEKEAMQSAKELKVIYLKDKIREIGRKLKEQGRDESLEEERLKKEFNEIASALSSSEALN